MLHLFLLAASGCLASAKTVTYDFNIGWVTVSDALFPTL